MSEKISLDSSDLNNIFIHRILTIIDISLVHLSHIFDCTYRFGQVGRCRKPGLTIVIYFYFTLGSTFGRNQNDTIRRP